MSKLTATKTYDDGNVRTSELDWPNHTAVEAAKARAVRFRASGQDFEWPEPTVLVYRHGSSRVPQLNYEERLEWRDS